MPRFTNGWVKNHRKILSEEWLKLLDFNARSILMHLVLMANITETRFLRNGTMIVLKRGSLLTSDSELCRMFGLSRNATRRCLKLLEKTQTITMERDKLGTVITICNYSKYQCVENEQETTPGTTPGTTIGTTPGTRIEELKNLRKEIHPEPECFVDENLNTDPEKTKKPKKPKPPKEPKPKKEASTAHLVVARYCDLFKEKFNVMPTITGVDAGALGKLNKTYGEEKAIRIVEAYFNLNDKWLADQYYPARLIHGQVNKIVVILEKSSPSSKAKTIHDIDVEWL